MNKGIILISYNGHCSQKLRAQTYKQNKGILLTTKVPSIMVAPSIWSFCNIHLEKERLAMRLSDFAD